MSRAGQRDVDDPVVAHLPGAPDGAAPQAFAYHRSVAPATWVLVGLASIELVVVHALLAMWQPWVAVAMSVLTLASMAWLVGAIRSFGRLPVALDRETLVMRLGTLRSVTVPVATIAGRRDQWDAGFLKQRTTFNLARIAYPNIVIELTEPVRVGRRSIAAVAHRLDDRAAFVAALKRLGVGDD